MSELWDGLDIEVIGVSGEYESGKTLFALSVDPKHTRYDDFEKSGGTYSGLQIAKRVDWPTKLLKTHPDGYKPLDAFVAWRNEIQKVQPGEYTVIVADPITDIEQGLSDYVMANPEEFGRTATQYQRSGGIYWGDVKAYWKRVLSDLAARCETFVFTSHMRAVWKGSTPTGRREPKGKDTLTELASLYLLLERNLDDSGKRAAKPSAKVLKSRLASTGFDDNGEVTIVPTLPPYLKVATPATIREYIRNPPDYKKLKAGEKVPVKEATEAELLEMKREIAETEHQTEELRQSRLSAMRQNARAKLEAVSKSSQQKLETAATKTAKTEAKAEEKTAKANGEQPPFETDKSNGNGKVSAKLAAIIAEQMDELKMKPLQRRGVLQKRGVEDIADLTPSDAEEIRQGLWNVIEKRKLDETLGE